MKKRKKKKKDALHVTPELAARREGCCRDVDGGGVSLLKREIINALFEKPSRPLGLCHAWSVMDVSRVVREPRLDQSRALLGGPQVIVKQTRPCSMSCANNKLT